MWLLQRLLRNEESQLNNEDFKNYFDRNYKDLDTFLIDLGVKKECLESIKSEKIKGPKYPKETYDEVKTDMNILVPVNKIANTTRRGNIGSTWYELVNLSFLYPNQYNEANIEPKRIWGCLRHLYVLGWCDWNKSFLKENVGNFNFVSYETDASDIEYHQSGGNGGGTHRLIAAKVGGAENILSNIVHKRVHNPHKYKVYKGIKENEIRLKQLINESEHFDLDEKEESIICECSDLYYSYDFSEVFYKMYDTYYKERFTYVESYFDFLRHTIEHIMKIEKYLNNNYNFSVWKPKYILKRKLDRMRFTSLESLFESESDEIEDRINDIAKELQIILAYNKKKEKKSNKVHF